MGVPKFYRWISERYPKINQIVSDSALLPEFDHLYLDMNGIIHGCTHPSDMDVCTILSERDMMLGIMHYLDRIITQIVKPKVSVYMAIDGVAPRAKLNQQRSRRFRSARDLAEATKDVPKDQDGNKGDVFDSNCITPGTEFLAKVSRTIQYFIRKKIKEDPLWHGLTIIFSGHDVPGEGEHKIMQHIREMRNQPTYQPNNRHCIYGQDADLIMLGLVTHEPHFTILREVIDFNFNFNNKNSLKAVKKFTKESDFQLLHLSVLREYLEIEFCYKQPEWNLERIIDDFVFMTFLVGNDFLPHMPSLDIGDGAFDLLFDLYREQRHSWGKGNYLTHSGDICDAQRLEVFIEAIGAVETEVLEKREKDDETYLKKRRKWDKRDGKPDGPSDAELKKEEASKQSDYMGMVESMMAKHSIYDDAFVEGWKPATNPGQKDFKGRYYFEKMNMTPIDKDAHYALRKSYMEGLMWCLAYYYKGCISWGWFYPYHYGPMLSDLVNIPKMFAEIKFELGAPLTPYQQLMGCLPPASLTLVPPLYRSLMTSPESPIIRFYPEDFEVDMNGKKNPWEGVNLLPFIDIQKLKDTIAIHCPEDKLSPDERKRNSLGKVYCYKYDITCTDTVESANCGIGLPDIISSYSSISIIEELESSTIPFKPELIPGTQIPYPGFPSLNVLPIASVELTAVGLNCFGSPSKYPNTILTLHQMPELPPLEVLAENVLGKSLFVNWPMMHEGRVVAISNEAKEIRLVNGKPKVYDFNDLTGDRWASESQAIMQTYLAGNGIPGSGGVQINEIKVRLKLVPLQGMKTNPANGSSKKLFGQEEADVPLQLALWQAPAPDPRFVERGPMTLQDRFPEGCTVLLTKGKYRGCKGIVAGVADKKNMGVKVQTFPAELPFGLAIARSVQESYVSSSDASRILKMHPGLFGKVTGRLQFEQGKYDLGLNLKSSDGMCVVGYTRKKVDDKGKGKNDGKGAAAWSAGDSVLVVGSSRADGNDDGREERIQWEYTPKAIRLIEEYKRKFPQLFNIIQKQPNEKRYDANKVFGPNGEAWLPVIREWLDNHESAKLPRSPVSTNSMSYEAVAAVQKAADVRALALKKSGYPKEALIKIPGSALCREGSIGATDVIQASDLNNNEAPELGDRVGNICAEGIPFGARGTVVGVHEAATTGSVEVVMDEEFMGGTSLQGTCGNFRGKLCAWVHLLKIAPENSKALVDKLVPKGAGRAAVDKILASIDGDAKAANPGAITSSWDSQVDAKTSKTPKQKTANPAAGTSPARAKSSSRADSAGRSGRKGAYAYKEARKPDEKGNGFKERKSATSGFKAWKALIASNSAPSSGGKPLNGGGTSAELKAMLGVGVAPSAPSGLKPPTTSGGGALDGAGIPESAQLKAMLGMGSPHVSAPETQSDPDATAGLKAILGVNAVPQPQQQHLPPPQGPVTAADKLMQLLMSKQQPHQGHGNMYPPAQSGFNFSYVEEGKEAPMPTQVMPPPAHGYPPMQYQMQGGMPIQPYGGSPPPHMMYPPPGGSPPPRMMYPPHGPPPDQFPPLGSSGGGGGGGPPEDQFPPLGNSGKPSKAPAPAVIATTPKEPAVETKKKEASPVNLIVPSNVAAKARR